MEEKDAGRADDFAGGGIPRARQKRLLFCSGVCTMTVSRGRITSK